MNENVKQGSDPQDINDLMKIQYVLLNLIILSKIDNFNKEQSSYRVEKEI